MKNWKKILLVALPMTLALAFTSFAGQWQQSMNGWWYQNDDGSYLTNGWYWLDGNNDGIAECYYFDKDGYMIREHGYVDGYEVDDNGAWIVDGKVQEKQAEVLQSQPAPVPPELNQDALSVYKAAQAKNNALDSMDVTADYKIAMSAEGESLEMGMNLDLKMKDVHGDGLKFYSTGKINMLGTEFPVKLFYTDGYYYMDMMDQKIKMKMPLEEAMKEAAESANLAEVDMSSIKNLQMHKDGENTVLTFDMDVTELNTMMEQLMGSTLQTSGTDISYKINGSSGQAIINSDGYYCYEKVYMDMDMSAEGQTLKYVMDIGMTINNPGQPVDFEIPSTEGYEEMTQNLTEPGAM